MRRQRGSVWYAIGVGRILLGTLLLLFGSLNRAAAQPPSPQPLPPTGDPVLDGIYYGAYPPGGKGRPVLVFVHGLGGLAQDWWSDIGQGGVNDMYLTAYTAGYRTAFVDLNGGVRHPAADMWTNGERLSRQIAAIVSVYGVDRVDLVTHSKGGVDAQAAVVYYGAASRVRRIITLAAPHWGAELADLLYTDWGRWLGGLLGLQDAATFSMQTGYMRLFRRLTDRRPENQIVSYHTGAGTDCCPEGSFLTLTGTYLSRFGPNDGIVTVASTQLPGAQTLFIEPFNHDSIRRGAVFPWIESALQGASTASSSTSRLLPLARPRRPSAPPSLGTIIRGGPIAGRTRTAFPIETGARRLEVTLLLSRPITATLRSPGGQTLALGDPLAVDAGLWRGAWVATASLPAQSGWWTLDLAATAPAAYLALVTVDSPLQVSLAALPESAAPGQPVWLQARVAASTGPTRLASLTLRSSHNGRPRPPLHLPTTETSVVLATEPGIVTLGLTLAGWTGDGSPFERSLVRSVAVLPTDDPASALQRLSR